MAYKYKESFKASTLGRISEPAVESGKRERAELDEVYRKAEAFEKVKKDIKKNLDYLYELPPNSFRAEAGIDLLRGILITMDDNEFDAKHKEGEG